MLSDPAAGALRDIAHHIELAQEFTRPLSFERLLDDTRTVYAVTRCLEIISEASRRIPGEVKALYPFINWHGMAEAANLFRHPYEDISARLVWDTVQVALPPLRDAVARELRKIER
jgi:uncharacterized protein with HEPN domain